VPGASSRGNLHATLGPRSLRALVEVDSPAWPGLEDAFAGARNGVEVLPRDAARSAATLDALQVTAQSTLGAVAYETGGLLIDRGWIRLLGGGCERGEGLADWNGLAETPQLDGASGLFIVGYDLIGGFFALDGAAGGEAIYFAPDTLGWDRLERGYTGLVHFLLQADLDAYYPLRWRAWESEAAEVPFDHALSLYPPPFMKEGKDLSRVSRRAVPARELWALGQDFASQLGGPGEPD